MHGPDGATDLRSPLPGRFNVYNVLAALAAVRAVGVPIEVAAAAIETAGHVPGRFQPVDVGQGFAVLVDYAHTPDSLENVLRAARGLVTESDGARVHVVFGCGGDRDRGKRPLMGEIAVRLADRVIVTSDNPRSEDPEAIIEEILAGTGPGSSTTRTAARRSTRRSPARGRAMWWSSRAKATSRGRSSKAGARSRSTTSPSPARPSKPCGSRRRRPIRPVPSRIRA